MDNSTFKIARSQYMDIQEIAEGIGAITLVKRVYVVLSPYDRLVLFRQLEHAKALGANRMAGLSSVEKSVEAS